LMNLTRKFLTMMTKNKWLGNGKEIICPFTTKTTKIKALKG